MSPNTPVTLPEQVGPQGAGSTTVDSVFPTADSKRFIVFLDDAPGQGGVEQRALALLNSLGSGGKPSLVYNQLNGFVIDLNEEQAQRLRGLGGVQSVEADAAVFLEPPIPGESTGGAPGQPKAVGTTALNGYFDGPAGSGATLPWGVKAVWRGEDVSLRGNFAFDTYAFVIDSGVDRTTGDLTLDNNWKKSWITGEDAFTDGLGHGTHVSGTIAALANQTGVVGVAPGAQVVSLKVFDSSGSGGSYSSIIDAINYAANTIINNNLDMRKVVINMSLGGSFSTSLDNAIKGAANKGIRFAIAAGNNGQDADNYSPAAAGDHPNVFTTSAVDSQYNMASWSNWDTSSRDGDDVDFAAPGVNVYSYYKNGQLAYLSGTSMAAPHVAGLLLTQGGLIAGDLVKPNVTSTADPFAWAASAITPPVTGTNQVQWGTTTSDSITGSTGNDQLAGVPITGSNPADLGRAQIDTLTGAGGQDLFLLADNRGTFYNDGSSTNQGLSDYASITDFNPILGDRIQLRRGSQYLIRNSGNNTDLFLGDGNKTFGTSDEFIARINGNLASGTGISVLGTTSLWTTFV